MVADVIDAVQNFFWILLGVAMPEDKELITSFPNLAEAFNRLGETLFEDEWWDRCIGLSQHEMPEDHFLPALFDPEEWDYFPKELRFAINSPWHAAELATPVEVEHFKRIKQILFDALWNEELDCTGVTREGHQSAPPRNVWKDQTSNSQVFIAESLVLQGDTDEWYVHIEPKSLKKLAKKIKPKKKNQEESENLASTRRKGRKEMYAWDIIVPRLLISWHSKDSPKSKAACAAEVYRDLESKGWARPSSQSRGEKLLPQEDTMARKLKDALESSSA